jgi:hypothetical protein
MGLLWRHFGEGSGVSGDTSVDLTPLGLVAGDKVFIAASEGGSSSGFSTMTGWTRLFNRINATTGDWALFAKTWSAGDSLSETLVPSVSLHVCYVVFAFRSSSGGTIVYGSPPASGYASGQELTNTPASTTLTFNSITEDEDGDIWLALYKIDNTSTVTVPSPWYELRKQSMNTNGLGMAITSGRWHDVTPSLTWTLGSSVESESLAMAIADGSGESWAVGKDAFDDRGVRLLYGSTSPFPESGIGQGGGIGLFVGD